MTRHDKWEWTAPIFIAVGIFAIYLSMTYLPLSTWGINISSDNLWSLMPWVVALGVGLIVLRSLWKR